VTASERPARSPEILQNTEIRAQRELSGRGTYQRPVLEATGVGLGSGDFLEDYAGHASTPAVALLVAGASAHRGEKVLM
jgi:hypothetical protein